MHHQKASEVSRETLQILKNGRYTHMGSPVVLERSRLAASVRNSTMYSDGRELPPRLGVGIGTESVPRVVLFEGDSFEAACWALNEDDGCSPVVLDFASDSEPGGGYKGNQQSTQEESLCRRSNLAQGLEALSDKYPIPTLGAAYVPDVCVFRGDEIEGYPLWAEPIWIGGVIAAALRSVDTGGDSLDPKQATFVRSKIDGVLAVARHHNHKVLVLGAWGCGAFGNSAPCIAALFKEALSGPHARGLSTVMFALVRKENSQAFKSVFNGEFCVSRSAAVALPQGREEKMSFQGLSCELSALVNESSVWEAAIATADITDADTGTNGGTHMDLRTELRNLGRALLISVLAAGESILPEYSEELAAVKAAADAKAVSSSSEVAAVLASLEGSVKFKVMEYARENGWLQKGRRDKREEME